MKTPFKHFDLPNSHLSGDIDYIPPKARSKAEIRRRRSLPHGSVLVEQQLRGLHVARRMVEQVVDEPDRQFVSRIIGAAGLNTAWYSYAKGSPVMRRRLVLPFLALQADGQLPPTGSDRLVMLQESFTAASVATEGLLRSLERQPAKVLERRRVAGRIIGDTALKVTCLPVSPIFSPQSDPFEVQSLVRATALGVLDESRLMHQRTGSAPSLAQLADADSDLSLYIRRQAPDGAYNAFMEATETAA